MSFRHHYHDDPIEIVEERAPRFRKLLFIISSVVIAATVGNTFAANISLSNPASTEFGQGVLQTTACSGSSQISMKPSSLFTNSSNAGTYMFNSLTVSGVPSSCNGSDFLINAYNISDNAPIALYNTSSSSIVVKVENGNYFGPLSQSGLAIVTNSATSFTITFDIPVAASNTTYRLSIQSGPTLVTLSCVQNGSQCAWSTRSGAGSLAWNAITSSSDGTRLAAAVYGGDILLSNDSGATWTTKTFSSNHYWYGIDSSSDGSVIVAVGQNSAGVQVSTDYGATWSAKTLSCGLPLSTAISADGMKIVVGCGNGGQVAMSSNQGATWTYWNPTVQWAAWVTMNDDGTRIAVATGQQGGNRNGPIYTSRDSGATFTVQNGSGNRYWRGIASNGDGSILVATSYDAGAFLSRDGGVTWAAVGPGSSGNIGASISRSGMVISIVNPSSGLFISGNYGASFTSQTSMSGLNFTGYQSGIASSADGSKIVAIVSGGAIYTGR